MARGNDLGAGSAPSSARSIHMIAKHRSSAAARVAPGGLLFLALAMCGPTDAMVDDVQAGQVQPGTQAENAGNYVVAGVCSDEQGKPLPGVRVVLYREDYEESKAGFASTISRPRQLSRSNR